MNRIPRKRSFFGEILHLPVQKGKDVMVNIGAIEFSIWYHDIEVAVDDQQMFLKSFVHCLKLFVMFPSGKPDTVKTIIS